jgi:hypothetical protein
LKQEIIDSIWFGVWYEGFGTTKLLLGYCCHSLTTWLIPLTKKYAEKIPTRADMSSCKSCPTLVVTKSKIWVCWLVFLIIDLLNSRLVSWKYNWILKIWSNNISKRRGKIWCLMFKIHLECRLRAVKYSSCGLRIFLEEKLFCVRCVLLAHVNDNQTQDRGRTHVKIVGVESYLAVSFHSSI